MTPMDPTSNALPSAKAADNALLHLPNDPHQTHHELINNNPPIFTKMRTKFRENADYRDHGRDFLAQPLCVEKETSPFMQLPAEIRIMVEEYALSYDEGVSWVWKEYCHTRRVGYFDPNPSNRKQHANPLAFVSRQLNKETNGLLFKLNPIVFNSKLMNVAFDDWSTDFEDTVKAWNHFFRTATARAFSTIRTLILECSANDWTYDLGELHRISEIADANPSIRVKFRHTDWAISPDSKDAEDAVKFVERGRWTEHILSTTQFSECARTWRILPNRLMQDLLDTSSLQQLFTPADLLDVEKWIKEGL